MRCRFWTGAGRAGGRLFRNGNRRGILTLDANELFWKLASALPSWPCADSHYRGRFEQLAARIDSS